MNTFVAKAKRWLAAVAVVAGTAPCALADPVLMFTWSPEPAASGGVVGVDIRIAGAVDLYAYQVSIGFDTSMLRASSVGEGPFLATAGSTFFDPGVLDDTLGTLTLLLGSLIGPGAGADGSGLLAHIDFDVLRGGFSVLRFTDALLLDSSLAELPVDTQDALIMAIPEPASVALVLTCLVFMGALREGRAPHSKRATA